jgi:hypothetical protein
VENRKFQVIRIETTVETAIEATPMKAANFLEIREPTSASTTKLANGTAGMSHNNLSTLSPHYTGRIGIERFVLMVQLQ